jgi:hypothetical protein
VKISYFRCVQERQNMLVKTTDLKRIHDHKRLLLVNPKQLYLEFKSHHLGLNIEL